jgi:anaerobic selenocysteine-containing dehydrogenase
LLIENNKIVKVRPDKANLRSQGYVCRKGIKVANYQHHRQRLEHPLKRENGQLVPIGWDKALTEIGHRLEETLKQYGPRSIAFVAGGGGGCQIGGRFSGRFLMSLGSRYLYTALGQEWTGRHYVRGCLYGDQTLFLHPDHDKVEVLLALGWNGWSSHGMPQTRRFIKSLSEDPDRTLVVVDPRPSETARHADIHLAITPGSDALLLKAMIAVVLKEGWHKRPFLKSHATGWEEITPFFKDFPVKDALQVCGLEFDQVKEVCRLFANCKSAIMSDLGVLMNRHSTLVSYLEEILLSICGRVGAQGGNVFTGTLSQMGVHTPPEDPNTWRTMHTNIPAIMGVFPPNVLPEEILSDGEDRIRALIVAGSNPLRSYADTSAYERAFKALDLLVVLDVAMSETANVADYILSGRTAYESYDTSFWSFNYPGIFFHLRRPLVEPATGTRENSWIITSLAEKMSLLPEIPESLYQAAKEDRTLFGQELSRYLEGMPEAKLKLPFVLSKTLGKILGSYNLAFLWGLIWSAPARIKEAMIRAGFHKGEDQTERVYASIMDHPEGIWLGQLDLVRNLESASTEDKRIHLYIPELIKWLDSVTPKQEEMAMEPDATFPLILMAGWHYDYNANTLMRDPEWNLGRRVGCLAVHPGDAAKLDLADGEIVRLTTRAGGATVEVQISKLTRLGMVLLPHGFGLEFEGKSVGVNVNRLTMTGHRDRIAGTPYHRHVPCRLEKMSRT